MNEEYIVEMRDIVKSFYGVTVLHHVDFQLKAGEVHSLVGENGAGKSTLIKILTGVYQKDSGSIKINGKEVEIHNAKDGRDQSVSCIHQELSLVEELTIAENVFLGIERTTAGIFLNDRSILMETQRLLDEMSLNLKADMKVSVLTVAQKQMVEICRALMLSADVIVMDEPTASLSDKEVDSLFEQIRKLKKQNKAVIYISHRLEEILKISDTVSVLRDGHMIETRPAGEITQNEMIEMMVGRKIENLYGKQVKRVPIGEEVIFEARNLSNKVLKNISFKLYKGEILGFAGLIGAGRTEMAQAVMGLDRLEEGELFLKGERLHVHSPRDAISKGITLIPEDRKKYGLVLAKDVAYNLTLTVVDRFIRGIRVDKKLEKEIVDEYGNKLSIKMTSAKQICRNLSGGNQQKVVISKWLARGADVIIFDEPTRGIDIGAKAEIYELIYQLANSGISVILISSELPEVINVSDRIAVMCEGKLNAVIDKKDHDESTLANVIGKYAVGGMK